MEKSKGTIWTSKDGTKLDLWKHVKNPGKPLSESHAMAIIQANYPKFAAEADERQKKEQKMDANLDKALGPRWKPNITKFFK